jgi:hypothetical protein
MKQLGTFPMTHNETVKDIGNTGDTLGKIDKTGRIEEWR